MWLLTDRGAMQASRQAARHGERVLHLDARHVADHAGAAVAVPSSTPDVVAVRGVHFDNAVREIRQLRWFAVVDGVGALLRLHPTAAKDETLLEVVDDVT